jgi:syntaxin 16
MLQGLSMGFHNFTGLNSREERSKQYFDTVLDQDFSQGTDWEVDNIDEQFGLASASGLVSQQQLLLLEEENTRMAARREHEVRQIVKSIVDLNEIFKDLAQMVVDQVIFILHTLHYIRTVNFCLTCVQARSFG